FLGLNSIKSSLTKSCIASLKGVRETFNFFANEFSVINSSDGKLLLRIISFKDTYIVSFKVLVFISSISKFSILIALYKNFNLPIIPLGTLLSVVDRLLLVILL